MRVVFTKNEEKKAGSPGSESARRGPCRPWGAAAAIVWISVASTLEAGPTCPAPTSFRVCQDAYSQPLGRVFLTWQNEASYDSHCILLDGRMESELPGSANFTSISGLSDGPHTFAIQSHCASLPSPITEKVLEVLVETPFEDPVDSMHCGFDLEQGFIVDLMGLNGEFESVDIFEQKLDDFPRFLKCQMLGGSRDQSLVIPEIINDSSRVFLQFFDATCHGSASVECSIPRTPPLGPPFGLQVFQTSYEKPEDDVETVDVILCWVRDDGQRGFEVLVDGKRVGSVGALLDTFFLNGLATGKHDFEVRMIPWEGTPVTGAIATATLKSRSPIPEPVGSIQTAFRPGLPIRCSSEPRRGTLHVSWDPGRSGIAIVDVFLQRGDLPLRSVITIAGDVTEIDLDDVFEDDGVALQFFDQGLFGSPVFGPGSFRRGDPNQRSGVDISDAVLVLNFLFSGGVVIDCHDAADANDDGVIDISDGLFILNFLFSGGRAPFLPGHLQCGLDMTEDRLPLCKGICAEP